MTATVVLGLAGIIGTLVGTFVGPMLTDRRKRHADAQQYARDSRLQVYGPFAVAVETLQLELDRRIAGLPRDTSLFEKYTDAMETERARIDLIGGQPVRAWAYRCRLSITAIHRALASQDGAKAAHYRAKLHEARGRFMTYARSDVAIDSAPMATFEGDEFGGFPPDVASAHLAWLNHDPPLDAIEATEVPRIEFAPGEFTPAVEGSPQSEDHRSDP